MKNQFAPADTGLLTMPKKIFFGIKKKSIFFLVTLVSISSYGSTFNSTTHLEEDITIGYSEDMIKKKTVNIISGKIYGDLGEVLPGATIKIKGSNKQVVAGADGSFSIEANEGDVLIVSFVGYASKEVVVGNQKSLNIKLKSVQNDLQDVVIVGYQKVHKKNTNASVGTITSKQLESIPVISVSTIISSLTTGIQTASPTGAPGGRSNLVIRGNTNVSGSVDGTGYSSPLYVIDGVQTSLEDLAGFNTSNSDFLATLNPNDIDKIDILKDASAAAIYGSRGANGVIIITTKKGGALEKPEFNFSLNTGVSPIPELLPIYVGSAERNAKWALMNKWWPTKIRQNTQAPMVLTDSLNPAFNNKVDYQGLFYRTGISNKYNLSMKGGTESSNYRISLGADNVKGVIQNSGYRRYTLNANLNNKVGSKFENQFITSVYRTENQTGQGNPGGGNFNFNSTLPTDPANLNSSLFYLSDAKINSLKGELSEKLNTDVTISTTISDYMKYDISTAFSLSGQLNYVFTSQKKDFYEPSILREEMDGYASYSLYQRGNLSSEIYLNYFQNFNNHTLSGVAGIRTDQNHYEQMHLAAQGFGSDAIKVINGRYKDSETWGATNIEGNSLLSYFGRFGYHYKERYQADVTFSRNGSSRFGENVRFANFPSASLGWIFSDEPFVKRLIGDNILNYGKVKATYGINGKEIDNNYLRYGSYNLGYGGNPNWANNMSVSSYGGVTGVIPNFNSIGNSELTWVNSEQWDIGVDLDLLNNRVNVTFDAYNKKTDQLLFPVTFPGYSGFNSAQVNVVGVMNYGFEASVKVNVFRYQNPWKMDMTLGISQNKNYVTALPNGNKDYINSATGTGYVVGLPLNLPLVTTNDYIIDDLSQLAVNPYTGQMQGYKQNGAWGNPTLGAPMWKDWNGDYWVDEQGDLLLDKTFKAVPDFTGFFNLNIKYKGWYMQTYSQFSFGSDVYDTPTFNYLDHYDSFDNWSTKGLRDLSGLSFWEKPGDGAAGVRFPAMIPGYSGRQPGYRFRRDQSLWYDSGDYWKVTNFSIGYTIDKSPVLAQIHISRMRIYGAVLNPYMWQRSKVIADVSQVNEQGHVYGNGYPQTKTFSFGLDVKF